MTDFIIWTLVILLTFLKCIFFAVAIIFIWIMIGKYSPKTTEKITNYGKRAKETAQNTFSTNKEEDL
jgi:uncharacterized membrane protein